MGRYDEVVDHPPSHTSDFLREGGGKLLSSSSVALFPRRAIVRLLGKRSVYDVYEGQCLAIKVVYREEGVLVPAETVE